MIIPKLWARLGNQCFMLAAAIAHAKKMDTQWYSPTSTLNNKIWPLYFNNVPKNYLQPSEYYKEKRHAFDDIPNYADLQIEGYFQSEKYFANAKREVQMALNFFAQPDDFVAVHIRRGDYLLYQDQFPVLPIEYYKRAMHECIIVGYKKFRIYSDDMQWCKEEFSNEYYNGVVIEFDNKPNELWAMRDMYNASAFIIANSTFSLFPATLRPDNPLVIAPDEYRWYGPKNKHLETCDLMPERFIKI